MYFLFDKVYVGGRNRLFQLSSQLKNKITVEIGPRNATDNFIPDAENKMIDNINKVLLIDYNIKRLITCNTVPIRSCSTRSLQNIAFSDLNVLIPVVSETEGNVT